MKVKLTEEDIRSLVMKSVKRVLKEDIDVDALDYSTLDDKKNKE